MSTDHHEEASGAAKPTETVQILDEAQAIVSSLKTRARGAANLVLVTGVIVIGLMVVYFTTFLNSLEEVTEPQALVNIATDLVDENLPEVTAALEQEVVRSAPEWASGLSRQAIAAVPTVRERLEATILQRVGATLERGSVLTEERFVVFLDNHRAMITDDLKALAASSELAEQRLEALTTALEGELRDDLEAEFADLFEALVRMNAKLERLAMDEDLTETEQLERRVLGLARQIQDSEVAAGSGAQVEAGD